MPAALLRSLGSPRVVIALCMILCIMFCAVFASRIAPNDPGDQNLLSILTPPFWVEGSDPAFVLGTDSLGRDVLSRLIYGARTAVLVAFFASLGAMIVGGSVSVSIESFLPSFSSTGRAFVAFYAAKCWS